MNTTQHSFFAAVTVSMLVASVAAHAVPPNATQSTNSGVTQSSVIGAIALKPVDCVVEFGKFTATAVASFGGVMIDNEAYGTYGTPGSGASQPTTVALTNGKVSGSIVVALSGHAPNNPNITQSPKSVGIEISKSADNKLTFTWTVDNKTYHAPVSNCASHLWTASAGNSAVMLRTGS